MLSTPLTIRKIPSKCTKLFFEEDFLHGSLYSTPFHCPGLFSNQNEEIFSLLKWGRRTSVLIIKLMNNVVHTTSQV